MNEILRDIAMLQQMQLVLPQLSLCGVPFGAPARAIPLERVFEVTLSPSVRSLLFDKKNDKPKLYLDDRGDPIPLARAIDGVIEHGEGVLHFGEHVSFGIERGTVARFCLYGRALSPLQGHPGPDEALNAFGNPDRLLRTIANGDELFFDAYFERSQKWLRWDHRFGRFLSITLGGHRNDLTSGMFGSIVRRDCF